MHTASSLDTKMTTKPSLADYIYSDLAIHIADHGEAPTKLTLSSLAAHYNVSLSPVRSAVERLVADTFLVNLANGRIAVGPRRTRPKHVAAGNIQAPVDHEAIIQTDLIRRSLLGEAGFLREHYAEEQYGVGRTVLRPILSRLAGQGLIERIPRRGWRIRPFDKEDLCSFLQVRELLELKALELAQPALEAERLEEMLRLNQSPDVDKEQALNNSLHSYWIGLCGNVYIQRFFSREAVYYRTLFDYAAPHASVVKEMASQHCKILENLLAKKRRAAADALAEHIRAQKPIVLTLIAQFKEQHHGNQPNSQK